MSSAPTVELGVPGDKIILPRIGLGVMGMSGGYGSFVESESVDVLNHSIDIGCIFWDTADSYGFGKNEVLISKVPKERRSNVFIGTKFGLVFKDPGSEFDGDYSKVFSGICGTPEYVRSQVEQSLKKLDVDRIDLLYQHRVDPTTPIETTVGAMAELVREGKVRFLGLSECSADELRRAYKVHPIAAVQVEYSPWWLGPESNGLFEACRELGVTVVVSSPLGRGFMTGKLRDATSLEPADWRSRNPRFQQENIDNNLKLVDGIEAIAKRRGVATSQLTLAWILAQEKNLIVIPGTKRINYLDENFAAGQIELTEDEIKEIRALIGSTVITGSRH
ncbi:hypothetical protein LPJ53_002540 [Coemansia erecta]|uniref:NADP-dependent oxidoreductase domain-containing protein n=1 Tax=Coemansia erecta TaxID=147472 RepID=A0A9W8CR32_9FUNG|nr:hypothetical protein LPJ53_002540 [Coemansia erecta]